MDPFLSEIRMFGGNFAPVGWALCDGQIMSISQNTALFSLLGTTYGGNGQTTFALPNLQGNVPLGQGPGPGLSNRNLGEVGGEQAVTLNSTQLPTHVHTARGLAAAGALPSPNNNVWAGGAGRSPPPLYAASGANNVLMSPSALSTTGGGLPHNNMPPYLGLTFIIALQGVFPPRS